jgi:hypothetical protein
VHQQYNELHSQCAGVYDYLSLKVHPSAATYQIHYDDYIFAPVVKSPTIAYFFEVEFFTGMNVP